MELDLAHPIVLNAVDSWDLGHLDKNKWNLATLIFEVDLHLLGSEAFADGLFDLLVTLCEPLERNLLVQKFFHF